MAKESKNAESIDTKNIFAQGVLVSLRTRLWGATGKFESTKYSVIDDTIDPKHIRASMDLLKDTDLIDAMRQVRGAAKRYIAKNSIYFPENGFDFIPKDRIEVVDEQLKKFQAEYLGYGNELIAQLKEKEAEFANAHPKLYDPAKYPTEERLQSIIKFQHVFRIFSTPDKELSVISPELYKQEMSKFKSDIEEMKTQTANMVCKELLKRIDALKDQCENGNINQATVNSVKNVMDKFDNVWSGFIDEKDIKKMVADVKLYMDGTDAEMLRWDGDFRKMVADKAAQISGKLANKGFTRGIDI